MAVLAGVLRPYDPVVWSSIDLTVTASTQVVDASRSLSALPFWLKFALGLAPAHPPPRGRASLSYFETERSKIDENLFLATVLASVQASGPSGHKPTGPGRWLCDFTDRPGPGLEVLWLLLGCWSRMVERLSSDDLRARSPRSRGAVLGIRFGSLESDCRKALLRRPRLGRPFTFAHYVSRSWSAPF